VTELACAVIFDGDGGNMQSIDLDHLAYVTGGAQTQNPTTNDNSFGRCGPGSSWRFLGDVYTPECRAHDAAVRGNLANGDSHVMAHVRALPQLPAAIGSYVRARLTGR
jgi:hypothetical protein